MRKLSRIVFNKKQEVIQLMDEQNNVILCHGDHGDDKIICDINSLHVVLQVLFALGCKMVPKTDLDDPEPCWVLYRMEEETGKNLEREMLVAATVSLAGIKVLLEQGKVVEATETVAKACEQVRDYLSDVADQEERSET